MATRLTATLAISATVLITACAPPGGGTPGATTQGTAAATEAAADGGGAFEYEGATFTLRADRPEGWVPIDRRQNSVQLVSATDVRFTVGALIGSIAHPPPPPPPPPADEITTVEQAVEYLSNHPVLEVTEPEEVTISGLPGQQLDVTATAEAEGGAPLFVVSTDESEPIIGQGPIGTDRYVFLQLTDDEVIVINIYDPFGERDIEDIMGEAEPMLEALEIEPAGG